MAKAEREFSSGGIVLKLRDSCLSVLLIKDSYGKWTWPKGKIEEGESSIDAAGREIGEETGIKNTQLISKIGRTNYFYSRDKKLIYKTVYIYLFESTGDEALSIQKSEIDDGRWFSKKEAQSKIGYKGAKAHLNKAVRIFKKHLNERESG